MTTMKVLKGVIVFPNIHFTIASFAPNGVAQKENLTLLDYYVSFRGVVTNTNEKRLSSALFNFLIRDVVVRDHEMMTIPTGTALHRGREISNPTTKLSPVFTRNFSLGDFT